MARDPMVELHLECRKFFEDRQIDSSLVVLTVPPRKELGDLASPVAFKLAKTLHRSPRIIADEIVRNFNPERYTLLRSAEAAGGGYINFHVDYDEFGPRVVGAIQEGDEHYGEPDYPRQQAVVVEHTAVNPNKPWHIGHARNAILGDIVGRVFRRVGYDVEIQNWINDAGRQVGETVYALAHFNAPVDVDEKFDHYLAKHYVRINGILSERDTIQGHLMLAERSGDKERCKELQEKLSEIEQIEAGVENALRKLEGGEYRSVVERCVEAQLQTAWRLDISYDLLLWETDIVRAQLFEEAMGRIQESPYVYVPQDGHHKDCLIIETSELLGRTEEDYTGTHTDKVVLIRSNSLPTYAGKDIAYQMWKFQRLDRDMRYKHLTTQPDGRELWTTHPKGVEKPREAPSKVVNVIGAEQSYAQQVVYSALKILGFMKEYAGSYHLAYGLVELERGRMSGRRGMWVSADEVIDAVVEEAHRELKERRGDELTEEEAMRIAEAIAIGAIRFEMCRRTPATSFTFRINEILDLKGFSSLYLQYAYVRAVSILRKAAEKGLFAKGWDQCDLLLERDEERVLMYTMSQFPSIVNAVAKDINPSLLSGFGYELATDFTDFYEKCPVLTSSGEQLTARLILVDSTAKVLRNTMNLIGIPLLEQI